MQPESKLYEITYILKGESEEEAINNLDSLKKSVEENGGMNLEESRSFKRRLAYPLGKIREAFSGSIKFFLKPDAIKNLEEFLKRELDARAGDESFAVRPKRGLVWNCHQQNIQERRQTGKTN